MKWPAGAYVCLNSPGAFWSAFLDWGRVVSQELGLGDASNGAGMWACMPLLVLLSMLFIVQMSMELVLESCWYRGERGDFGDIQG